MKNPDHGHFPHPHPRTAKALKHRDGLPAFDGIIFDMDGLLLDTEPTYAHAWRQAGLAFGVRLDDAFLHSLFGHHADDVEQRLAAKIGTAFDRERFFAEAARLWNEEVERNGVALMPGAEETLAALTHSGTPYALATNSNAVYAELCLKRAGLLERFPVKVCRDEVKAGKPEPDLFIEAARRLGLPTDQCLVLEDSPTGLLAAYRAGAIPILVSGQAVPDEARRLAQAVYTSLREALADFQTGGSWA